MLTACAVSHSPWIGTGKPDGVDQVLPSGHEEYILANISLYLGKFAVVLLLGIVFSIFRYKDILEPEREIENKCFGMEEFYAENTFGRR